MASHNPMINTTYWERRYGLAVTPNAEVHVADSINDGTAVAPFVADAGNDAWGNWLQIIGSGDIAANKYRMNSLIITAAETGGIVYFIQTGFGATGAASLTAGTYTEMVFESTVAVIRTTILTLSHREVPAGTKGWVRILCRGTNTSTLSFYIGLHVFEA